MNAEKYKADFKERLEAIKEKIEAGADVNRRDRSGRTILFTEVGIFCWHPDFVQWLIDHGADVNAVDKHGNTPLHAMFAFRDAARILILNGANVNAVNDKGITPFLKTYGLTPELLRLMIDHGLDLEYMAPDGKTILDYCKDTFLREMILSEKRKKSNNGTNN